MDLEGGGGGGELWRLGCSSVKNRGKFRYFDAGMPENR